MYYWIHIKYVFDQIQRMATKLQQSYLPQI